MNLLEQLVLRRAEEQLAAKAWLRADRGEHLVKPPTPACEVCGKPAREPNERRRADLCVACVRKGFRARRCPCGRPMRSFDFDRGECSACRRERNAVEPA